MATEQHPALSLCEEDRVDYLSAVACLVMADGAVHTKEIEHLRRLCSVLQLSKDSEASVMTAARDADRTVAMEVAESLVDDPVLRVSLLTDVMVLVFADGKVDEGELEALTEIATVFRIPNKQLSVLARYVAAAIDPGASSGGEDDLAAQLAEGLDRVPRPGAIAYLYRQVRA